MKRTRPGADSVTTEFFCMESRANEQLKARYAEMSDICKFDIWKGSTWPRASRLGTSGSARPLRPRPLFYKMRDFAHSLGLRFHVSDATCRECNDACNCCGVPPEWGVSQTGAHRQRDYHSEGEGRSSGSATYPTRWVSISTFSWVKACGF